MTVARWRDQRRDDDMQDEEGVDEEESLRLMAPVPQESYDAPPRRPRRRREPDPDYDDDDERPRKAAWPLRLLAWGSMLALFFGIGYGVATFGLKWLDAQGKISQPEVVDSPEEAQRLLDKGPETRVSIRRGDYRLHILGKEGLESRTLGVIPGVTEEDLRTCLEAVLEPLQAEAGRGDPMRVLHLFRAGDMLYLDINQPFLAALERLPSDRGILFMTGLVRSVVENFPPSVQVQIMINGKIPAAKGPIDLTVPWTLAPQS